MSALAEARHAGLLDALAGALPGLAPASPGCFRFALPGLPGPRGHARLTPDWVLLAHGIEPSVGGACPAPWELLELQAGWPGAVRVVRASPDHRLELRAEVPLVAGLDVCRRLCEAGDALAAAPRWLAGEPHAGSAVPPATTSASELVRAAGWIPVERAGGRCSVELETAPADGAHRALCEATADGVLAVFTELCSAQGLGSASREAAGTFLLSASACVRHVRPVVRGGVLGLETRLPPDALAGELDAALAAASVACALLAREATCFDDDSLAREYLAAREGGCPSAAPDFTSALALKGGKETV